MGDPREMYVAGIAFDELLRHQLVHLGSSARGPGIAPIDRQSSVCRPHAELVFIVDHDPKH